MRKINICFIYCFGSINESLFIIDINSFFIITIDFRDFYLQWSSCLLPSSLAIIRTWPPLCSDMIPTVSPSYSLSMISASVLGACRRETPNHTKNTKISFSWTFSYPGRCVQDKFWRDKESWAHPSLQPFWAFNVDLSIPGYVPRIFQRFPLNSGRPCRAPLRTPVPLSAAEITEIQTIDF